MKPSYKRALHWLSFTIFTMMILLPSSVLAAPAEDTTKPSALETGTKSFIGDVTQLGLSIIGGLVTAAIIVHAIKGAAAQNAHKKAECYDGMWSSIKILLVALFAKGIVAWVTGRVPNF